VLDFDTDDDDEPRTIVIRGFGPRWAEQPLLPAALKGND
jgi:tRNA threonylcarbamoyladenosine biosynthesis protein TsaE